MDSRFFKLVLLLTATISVIIIQVNSTEDHKYLLQTSKNKQLKDSSFNENKINDPNLEITNILQRSKRQSGYGSRSRRYPYPIPILVGGGFVPRGFGTRGFGSRGLGGRGFGSRGFGARGFGGRGIGGIGRGIGGIGGRGRG